MRYRKRTGYKKKKYGKRFKKRSFTKRRKSVLGRNLDQGVFTMCGSLIQTVTNAFFTLNVGTAVYSFGLVTNAQNIMANIFAGDARAQNLYVNFEFVALKSFKLRRRVFHNAGTSTNSNFWGVMAVDPTYRALGGVNEQNILDYKEKKFLKNGDVKSMSFPMKAACRRALIPYWQDVRAFSSSLCYEPTDAGVTPSMPGIVTFSSYQNSASIATDVVYEDVIDYVIQFKSLNRVQ